MNQKAANGRALSQQDFQQKDGPGKSQAHERDSFEVYVGNAFVDSHPSDGPGKDRCNHKRQQYPVFVAKYFRMQPRQQTQRIDLTNHNVGLDDSAVQLLRQSPQVGPDDYGCSWKGGKTAQSPADETNDNSGDRTATAFDLQIAKLGLEPLANTGSTAPTASRR